MYAIIDERKTNKVVHGPIVWDKQQFQSYLYSKMKISFTVPYANPSEKVIVVNDYVKIMPVSFLGDPSFDIKTQALEGPLYNYYEDRIESYKQVIDLDLDRAKNNLYSYVKKIRHHIVSRGFKYNLNGTDIILPLNEEKNNFFNGVPGNWKLRQFTELFDPLNDSYSFLWSGIWVELTQDDLDTICSAIKTKLQEVYDDEKTQLDNINNLSTMEEISDHAVPGIEIMTI